MNESALSNLLELHHMANFTNQGQSKKFKIDAPIILGNILQESGARYIQLLYDAVGDLKFRNHQFFADHPFEPALNEYLRSFVEEEVKENNLIEISAEELDRCVNGFPLLGGRLTKFVFLPVCSAVNRLGVLILGYDSPFSDRRIPEKRLLELIGWLINEKQKLVECKEKISRLNKTLITVQEPRLLGDIMKHQINPLLNLLTSAIICAKDGKAANEYRFYYNYNEFPRNDSSNGAYNPPHTIGVENFTYLYDKLRRSNESELTFELNFDRYADKEELHPFFYAYQNQGFHNAIIVNLLRGTETVGFWVLIFNKGFDTADLPDGILDAVAVQMANTVHSINTFSQLIDAKKEGEILQSLNIDLASSRDERNLLKLIRTKLLNLFQFSHHFIYKINDDQITVSMMLMDSHSRSQFHPSFETVMRSNVYIADGVFNKVLIASEPVIFDLGKLNERGQLPLYLRINYESGVKKVAMLALRVDSCVMGIWCVAFTEEQLILPRYLELIKTAAAPISIAVANIRINESLKDREAERDSLMDLSFDLTTVRSKDEFTKTIEPYLRKLFVFNNLSIFVDQDDYEDRPFIYFSSNGAGKNAKCFALSIDTQFMGAINYSRLYETTDVGVVGLDILIGRAGGSTFLECEYEEGIRTVIVVALRNENRHIGVLSLYLSDGGQFSEQQLHLFKEISYQIAKAVSNILYNEEIARREQEKELLLTLSEDIAAVREKDQLIKVINERLKPVLKFTHISLSMKCSDGFAISFLTDPGSKSKSHLEYGQIQRQDIRQCKDFINFVDASPGPIIISKNQDHGFKDLPKFLSVNFDSGIEEILIARLFDGISVFGYWVLCFSSAKIIKTNQFGLLQGIANQFSTAIYNIIANMEIAERQKENELLITLSNDSAGLRNYCQLMLLISTKLRNVFDFDSFYVGVLDEDGDSFDVLIPEGEMETYHQVRDLPARNLTTGLKDMFTNSDQPIVISREGVYEVFWESVRSDCKLKNAVVTNFIHDNKLLAVWVMFFQEEKRIDQGLFRLIKGISDQLSIAIANIRINERLAKNERQKGLLLSLSTKVSSARNPVELLKVLATELKTVLKFSHGSIVLFDNKEKTFALPWVLPSESKSSGHVRYKDITGLTPVYDGVADLALKSSRPLIVDIAAFPKEIKMPLYMQVSFESGMSHVVFIKLVINGEVLGFWVLWYDSAPADTSAYLEQIEQIASVLSVPIFNISFNEQINRREHEKSNMLDFAGAISDVKDKFELRKIFNHYLKNLCLIEDICLHWFTDDRKSQFCYFWDDDGWWTTDEDFKLLITSEYPANDIVFGKLIASESAESYRINEIIDHPDAPPYLKLFRSPLFSEVIGVPLFKGKEMVGVLFVKEYDANSADQPLFKGLCAQLAIAVSDLIATDKVTKQLAEINSYKERLEEETIYLRQELETSHHYSEIIGESPAIKEVFHQVSQVASSDSTVLILGETGTGKELIARAIHNNSPRNGKLMVKVNCAALPATLIESELFGHERGSFTGATEKRIGKFELANGGTLFLDEIGELPLELQVKFLRALQEREIERIGGRTTIKVDVRIIAATNRNLDYEVAEGRFRSDLYFRLSTFPIMLPSLRERREDIPLLATYFVNRFAKKTGKSINTINQKAMQELITYGWPGNVRELEHQIERSVLLTKNSTIKSVSLPTGRLVNLNAVPDEIDSAQTIDDHERVLILKTLKECFGKVSGQNGASARLGVPSSTLNSKMKRLGIKKNFLR